MNTDDDDVDDDDNSHRYHFHYCSALHLLTCVMVHYFHNHNSNNNNNNNINNNFCNSNCILCSLLHRAEGVSRVQDVHDVISIWINFRYLAFCITLIAKPTCIYFMFSAVNITFIDIFLRTLLHLAGYIYS